MTEIHSNVMANTILQNKPISFVLNVTGQD